MRYKNRLFELRGNLSQKEFAEKIGLSQQNYANYESGKQGLKSDLIATICETFGCSAEWLLELDGDKLIPKNARPAVGMAMGLAPRLGKVHAGVLTEPEVFDESTMVQVPQFLLDADPESFVVSSEGDCMDKVFAEGSDLVVSRKKQPKDKSVVLASVDGSDYIVRRLHITTSTMILSPESHNPEHEDIIITRDSEHTLEIPGVVTWFQSSKEME